ncbi:MAG: TonB-dependent receptor [Saprospiraceae bacterium]|nr:TonB-dependent receptor [Saprospiraceae bacterium]
MNQSLAFLFFFIGMQLHSQDLVSDTTKTSELSSVTIYADKSKSIPGSGQYISPKILQQLNQINVNNVVRLIPGVSVRDEEGFGLRPNIGLRGTPVNRSARITLMEDGILIAPAPYSDPSAYYFPSFTRMAGIEILKGSSQIKYGPYTIGGALNLLSVTIPESFKANAQISYGSFGTNLQRIWVGDSHKNFDYVFDVNRLASKGFKELDNGGNTGFDRRDIMGKVRWHSSQYSTLQQSLTLKFVNSTENGNETYLGLSYEDFKNNHVRRYSATQKDHLDLSHNHVSLLHTIAPINRLDINTSVYFCNTYRDWARVNTIGGQSLMSILTDPTTHLTAYQIMIGKANGDIDYQSAARTYFSKGIQSNAHYNFKTGIVNHNLQLGIRYHMDQADRYATRSQYVMTEGKMILSSVGVKGNQENQIRNGKSLSSFLSYDLRVNKLKISPGLRFENIILDLQNYGLSDVERTGTNLKSASNELSILVPGIGINYEINSIMNVFIGSHKGFSPPGMPSVSSTLGQAKAETSVNYELGYRYDNNRFKAQVVGFINHYNNILGSDNLSGGGAGTGDMFNAGIAMIQGIELNCNFDLIQSQKISAINFNVPVSFSFTYTDARFHESFKNAGGDWGTEIITDGDRIPFTTPLLLNSSIAFENSRTSISLLGHYNGTTRVKPSHGDIIVPDENVKYSEVNAIEAYLILDLSANYKLNKNFAIFGTVNNITNNKAIVANLPQGYRPNMPIAFTVGMKFEMPD